ncbi:MAG: BTAD domain-containing putative transcriptional regulator [bacterium]|nr:BTAD domain-containing putative transcriptional regulator [bacterium]
MSTRQVLLLGSPRIEENRHLVQLERRKAFGLLAYLIVNRQFQAREALAALFWPDYDASRASAYLRNTLWTLNKGLGEDWAIMEGETVAFNGESGIRVDLIHFLNLLNEGDAEALTEAVGLVRGEFMAGFTLRDSPGFDEWRAMQAEEVRRRFAAALEALSEHHALNHEDEQALGYARRWLALDNLSESAHRQLMRLYAWSGEQAAALRQYRELGRLLQAELGVEPAPETVALAEAIQARQLPLRQPDTPVPHRIGATSAPASAVPAASAPVMRPPVHLPTPTTPFIGRTSELAEIARLLEDPACRLLTLVGPGGIGKTRLAIQAASDLAPHFPDGVYFVSLVGVWFPEFIVQTVLSALNCTPSAHEDVKRVLLEMLREMRLLLVFDNFEHLLDSAELISEILAAAPQVKVLTTSRERLNLQEEWLLETGGLPFPAALPNGTQNLEDYGAVRLFMQSARRVRPEFALHDPASVARICRLVEGMPLAIELAATWVQMLSTDEIAQEIQNGLDFLETSTRNVPERHRSLRAVFEYSWEQLTPQERTSLSRLSVFMGGFQQEAAGPVAGASLHILRALVNKSLLRRNINGRYELHELLRQFAENKLSEAERLEAKRQHARYYAQFVYQACVRMKGPEEPQALDDIEREIDNVRHMWHFAAHTRDLELLRMSLDGLGFFYNVRSRAEESLEMVKTALAQLEMESDDPAERLLVARLLTGEARARSYLGHHFSTVSELTNRALALLRQFPGSLDTALSLSLIATLKNIPGRKDPLALEAAHEALDIYRKHGDRWGTAVGLYMVGAVEHTRVHYAVAREYLEQSLALWEEIRQPSTWAATLGMMSESAFTAGDTQTARAYLHKSLPLYKAIGNRLEVTLTETVLSAYDYEEDSDERAAMLKRALKIYEELRQQGASAWTMMNLAWNRFFIQFYEEAIHYQEEGARLFNQMGDLEGESWSYFLRASIETDLGHYDLARQFVQRGLEALSDMVFPWGVCGAQYILGRIALCEGDLVTARRETVSSIRIAHEVESVTQRWRHMSLLAEILLAEEQADEAALLLAYLATQEISWTDVETRKRLARLQAKMDALPAKQWTAAQAEAETLTLDAVMARFVGA